MEWMVLLIALYVCHGSAEEKRLVLHSGDDIATEFQALRLEIEALKAKHSELVTENHIMAMNHSREIQALQYNFSQELIALKAAHASDVQKLATETSNVKHDQGSTYVRWGRTTCDGNGTEAVYSGFTAGSPYDIDGGAASFVCLPQHPTWGKYQDGRQDSGGFISGTEFEPASLNFFPQNMADQDAPCVVCRVPRATTLMIAGRVNCYAGWTMEYTGYLMTGHTTHKGGTDYVCIDASPEAVYHGEASLNGKLLYPTEVKCGSLPCQEYPDGRELACVVCSK